MVGRQAGPRPALPPEGPLRPARPGPPGLGGRSALQPLLPPAPQRPAAAGHRRAAAPHGRAHLRPAPRPQQAALGDLDARGPGESRWALLSKVHHCMVDGVSATDLMSVMFGRTMRREAEADRGSPTPEPSGPELVRAHAHAPHAQPVRAATHRARGGAGAARSRSPRRGDLLRGMASAARIAAPASAGRR